ncbi:MAG: hypothetical protein AVDCRST_MAG64-313 [uncultured Phycisphaerae bacterium]|uniref:Uncharacterized protein n=1 Tax=uncultured Phycisphaerae bacterium TaxID=904963 RepID=A0A6J4N334_9BACT|nr:MAG: hypothetical protein AVDCRST_MAG64-313 [uncultured Phycisphaerae bacterium]
MDSKTYGIGILTLTATALLIANLFSPSPVIGEEAVANDDMQAVTARTVKGGDALYLLDNGSGKVAVFMVDPRNGLQLMAVEDVQTGFRGGK